MDTSAIDAHADARVGSMDPAWRSPVPLQPNDLIRVVREAVGLGGAIWIQVTGHSMNPVVRHGDSVLIAAFRAQPRVGDVVFLERRGRPLLHRVVRVTAETLTTRGDALRSPDDPLERSALIGRALVVRKGTSLVTLTPTLAFGPGALLRWLAWRTWGRLAAVRRAIPFPRRLS